MFAPNVTIITGEHRTDITDKHIIEVGDDNKLPEHDADVVIEDGAWVASMSLFSKGLLLEKAASLQRVAL